MEEERELTPEDDTLQAALLRLLTQSSTAEDMTMLLEALRNGQFALAVGERAVALGGDVNDAVIITGDGNTVQIFKGPDAQTLRGIIQQMQQTLFPAAFLTFHEFSQRAEQAALASHQGALVGQESTLEGVKAFLAGPDRVMMLYGVGGIGKTRLLLELPSLLLEGTVLRFTRTEADSIDHELSSLSSEGSTVIVIDDAHRFTPLANMREVLVNPALAGKVKLLLATRNVFKEFLLTRLGPLPDEHINMLEVEKLRNADIDRLLQNTPHAIEDEATRRALVLVVEGNPLIAHIAAGLVQSGAALTGLTRDEVLTRYLDYIIRDLSSADETSYDHCIGYLELLSALDKIDLANEELCSRIRQTLDMSARQETITVGRLVEAGLVERTWKTLKIASEVLSDHILLSRFFDAETRRSDYQQHIIEPFFAFKPKEILTALAKAEQKGESPEAGLLLGQKLDELLSLVSTGGNFLRLNILNWLDEVAFLRSDDIVALVADIVDGAEHPVEAYHDPWWGSLEITHEMILEKAVDLLSKTIYGRSLEDTISYLYRLSVYRPENATYARVREKAKSALTSIATFVPGKPYAVHLLLLKRIMEWIEQDPIGNGDICLALLVHLLKMDWEISRTEITDSSRVILEQGLLGPDNTLRTIRERVLDGLYALYRQTPSLSKRLEIVEGLEAAVVFMRPDIQVPSAIKSWSQIDCIKTAHFFLEEVIPGSELPIMDAVWKWLWRAEHLGGYVGEELTLLQQRLQGHRLYQLYRLLIDRFRWDNEEDRTDWKANDQRRQQEIEHIIRDLSDATFPQAVHDLAVIAEQVQQANRGDPYWFNWLLEMVGEWTPLYACELIERTQAGNLALQNHLGYVIAGLRRSDPESARAYVMDWMARTDRAYVSAALQGYAFVEWNEVQEDEWELLSRLITDTTTLDNDILRLVPSFARHRPEMAVDALKRIAAREDTWQLRRVAEILTWPDQNGTGWAVEVANLHDYVEILQHLELLPQIDPAVEQCLNRLGQSEPMRVVDFLERRIARAGEYDSKEYRAIPFRFVSGLESIRSNSTYRDVLRRVRDWMVRDDARFGMVETPLVLLALAGNLDEILYGVLMEWVESGNVRKQRAVATLLRTFNSGQRFYELSRELIRRTSDEDVQHAINDALASSPHLDPSIGWGILSQATRQRIGEISRWQNDSSLRVRRFANRTLQSLQTQLEFDETIENHTIG